MVGFNRNEGDGKEYGVENISGLELLVCAWKKVYLGFGGGAAAMSSACGPELA